ncbi:hypothetical protein PsYK624_036940 [Phanerochaete sordida]|uniref:Uncharacterized protein n=1 Tax=Phanerochaete sordida TaxID=48140 RepID=A0A9P3L9T6_9APHY|nr:hypothetical protein PsYK624_036940 [Phanerochaete sordida]
MTSACASSGKRPTSYLLATCSQRQFCAGNAIDCVAATELLVRTRPEKCLSDSQNDIFGPTSALLTIAQLGAWLVFRIHADCQRKINNLMRPAPSYMRAGSRRICSRPKDPNDVHSTPPIAGPRATQLPGAGWFACHLDRI